ncbi:MAG: Dimethylmenaquinone methyltransferase [Deltaproteobacteria bacterium]|nr:Dimethylmenaquinone methyltransferase [Deltaproteobacteria bacterium]
MKTEKEVEKNRTMAKMPEKYRKRLMGLIPLERLKTWQVPRPSKSLLQDLLSFDGLTPTLSDILDSMGLTGAIPASILRPVLSGKKIAGPAITLKYIPEQITPAQAFHERARAKLADRDAYALTEPGDIVVIDGGGMAQVSAMGGLSTTGSPRGSGRGRRHGSGIYSSEVYGRGDSSGHGSLKKGRTPDEGLGKRIFPGGDQKDIVTGKMVRKGSEAQGAGPGAISQTWSFELAPVLGGFEWLWN